VLELATFHFRVNFMASPRLPVEQLILDFRHVYQMSLLACARAYLESGDEQMMATIGLHAQFIKPTAAEIKEISKLIDELVDKHAESSLSTRELVLLGTAYEYGLYVAKDYQHAFTLYMAASKLINTGFPVLESNRDCGHALANAASLYHSEGQGIETNFEKGIALAIQAAELGSEFGFAHLGCFYANSSKSEEGIKNLLKAPRIFFAVGRLGYEYKGQKLQEAALAQFEKAARLGCPQSMSDLAESFKANNEIYTQLTYESSLFLANMSINPGNSLKEINDAKAKFQLIEKESPEVFDELSDLSPWLRVQPLLDEQAAIRFIETKTARIAYLHTALEPNFTQGQTDSAVLVDLISQYAIHPEYVALAKKEAAKWQAQLGFWKSLTPEQEKEHLKPKPNPKPIPKVEMAPFQMTLRS
jgi:hypothetical protein